MADVSGILKPAKFGAPALDKESVMIYIGELGDKLHDLEKENEELRSATSEKESGLVKEYKRDLEAAEKKAKEAEKTAQESIAKLKGANEKAVQLAAALKAEKEGRSSDAQKMKQLLQQAQAKASKVDEGKLREYQEEIVSLKGEISELSMENSKLKNSVSANGELSASVEQLQTDLSAAKTSLEQAETDLKAKEKDLADKDSALSEKDTEIDGLKKQVTELESKVSELEEKAGEGTLFAPEMDMAALYADAQKNANQLVFKAKAKADETVKNAEEKAKKTIEDAEAQAEKTVADANAEAEKIAKDANERAAGANAEADKILNKAKEEAEADRSQAANEVAQQEKKIRQLTSTIKSMLSIEIDGIEKSLKEAGDLMTQAAQTLDRRLASSKSIISEARESVNENAKLEEEKTDEIINAPLNEEPAASKPKNGASMADDFAESMMNDFASLPDPEGTFNKPDNKASSAPKPKKFTFDMNELIKDAEANVTD